MKLWARLTVAMLLMAVPVAAQYRSVGGKNKVRYDQFDWRVYQTPHFEISYYDRVAPVLDKVASFAESSYDELARRLNFQILEPVPLIVYATHAEFEQTNIIVGFIPEGVGAFASPVRNRMVLPVDLPDRELQALIQHELTHIFQYEILFQGRVGRALYARPPLWFMEGMASFYANDEDSRDEMYMRDAAMSDMVPSIAAPVGGFLAYRFGHKVFEFVEDAYGEDAVRDFVFSFRGGLGGNIERPVSRVLNMEVEEFDAEFRAWLRRRYLPFEDRGTPREYGRPFRSERAVEQAHEASPAVSPSGELVAAFTTVKGDIDVAIFGVPDRRLYKNLTAGHTSKYEYLVAQGFTVGPAEGRDLAYSPDGNHVAVFARSERGRVLLLLDANRGGIDSVYDIELPVDQPSQPAYDPDGRSIAFHAVREGQWDIFRLDTATGEVSKLTDDEWYDAAPTYSPDGRSLVYTTEIGDFNKLVRVPVANPSQREQLTFGAGNDEGASFSPDGSLLYFASDRQDGVFDIYQLELDSREVTRVTYVSGGAFNPVPLATVEGDRIGFQAYHRGRWALYSTDLGGGEPVGVEQPPTTEIASEAYLPAVTITVDPDKSREVGRRKLFIDDAQAIVGVDNEGNFLSQTYIGLADQYGDRRINILFSSIDTFSDFQISYVNLEPRLQWGASIFDYRTFYRLGYDPLRDRFSDRQQVFRFTAASFDVAYPLSRYYRLEGSVGYFDRSIEQPFIDTGTGNVVFNSESDQAPYATAAIVGDTTRWAYYGPHYGSRWELQLNHAYDTDGGGALTQGIQFDGRKYLPLTRRAEIALRLFAGIADGNNPSIYGIGGTDTVRGFPIRSLAGNHVAFANIEWRFPLIDRLDLSFLPIGEIRGRLFLDVGYSCYDLDQGQFNYLGQPGCTFMGEKTLPDGTVIGESGRLTDGVAVYGFGFTVNLLGLPFHWDFSKRFDGKDTIGGTETDFWIGFRF